MNEHETGQITTGAARAYEAFFVPALFAEWPTRLLTAAGARAGDHVLDVACGTGVLARKAVEIVGTNGNVVGIDINDAMLDVARSTCPEVTWRRADAVSLPFGADTYDRVVSQFALMFFPDRVRALGEMLRVARPGGTVSVAVWASLEATPGYAAVSELLDDLFGADVAHSIRTPYVLGERAAFEAVLRDAGIDNAVIETIPGRACFPSIESWIYTDIKAWTLADLIDDADFAKLRDAAPDRLSKFVLGDGSVTFDTPAHVATFTKHAGKARGA